jgi:hypothetical protein
MQAAQLDLRCRVITNDSLDLGLVCGAIFLEEVVGISLGWRVGVGVIEEVLNTEKNLLDGNRRLPTLFLVQNRQADGTRGVDVGVE